MIEKVQEGMWAVVNAPRGTGYGIKMEDHPEIVIAAKTGTAEYCEYIPEEQDCLRIGEGDDAYLPTHAWFVAYAPYENPEIAVVVFVYNGGEGSETAVPVAKTILEAYFSDIRPR